MNKKELRIGLLSHYFQDTNLGCSALSICNVVMIDNIAKELGITVKYIIMVNEKQPHVELNFTESPYEYRVFPSTKKLIKHPLYYFKTDIFDGCDLVFNLCAGDGFTDIYGKWRTFSESYMVLIASRKKVRVILAPQTIGPFSDRICRIIAKKMMDSCSDIFVRDHMSYELCCKMGQKQKTTEVIDVALALPYKELVQKTNKNAGVNVSGLLYNDRSNRFGLTIDYREFIDNCVKMLQDKGYTVHLIPHVILKEESGEDDFLACKNVHSLYPNTVLTEKFISPIDAKNYISGMDIFTGARMHATIAAISSGVPVIPIAYSRKVNGLYGNLNYSYFIDAKDNGLDTNDAISVFEKYLNELDKMRIAIDNAKEIYERYLDKYRQNIKKIINDELENKDDT